MFFFIVVCLFCILFVFCVLTSYCCLFGILNLMMIAGLSRHYILWCFCMLDLRTLELHHLINRVWNLHFTICELFDGFFNELIGGLALGGNTSSLYGNDGDGDIVYGVAMGQCCSRGYGGDGVATSSPSQFLLHKRWNVSYGTLEQMSQHDSLI